MRSLDFKPMLAAPLSSPTQSESQLEQSLGELRFPVLASPKVDGIRCTTLDIPNGESRSVAMTRSLKPIPNLFTRKHLEMLPPNLDGELMTMTYGDLLDRTQKFKNFGGIMSDIMSEQGEPLFEYHIFDYHVPYPARYEDRLKLLYETVLPTLPSFVRMLTVQPIFNIDQLNTYMSHCIQQGHEGICFRTPDSPYKYGRSTLKQQWLVKWKLFATAEAEVVGYKEEMHNANEAERNELGYLERSSHQANMRGKERLGALIVKKDGVEFKIGTGFDAAQREQLWATRETLKGKLVTFKHQSYGMKDAPRIPVFIGFRDRRDLSPG